MWLLVICFANRTGHFLSIDSPRNTEESSDRSIEGNIHLAGCPWLGQTVSQVTASSLFPMRDFYTISKNEKLIDRTRYCTDLTWTWKCDAFYILDISYLARGADAWLQQDNITICPSNFIVYITNHSIILQITRNNFL